MEESRSSDKLFGNLALGLLVVGLLAPFIIAVFASQQLAVGFGVVALILALLFGVIGIREKTGKVTVIATVCLAVLAIAATGLIYFTDKAKCRRMNELCRTEMESQKRKALNRSAEQDESTVFSEGAPSEKP